MDWHDEAASHLAWATGCWQTMEPYAGAGVPVTFLGDEGEAAVRASYGPNYARLAEVKRSYDPNNIFHLNQNSTPSSAP